MTEIESDYQTRIGVGVGEIAELLLRSYLRHIGDHEELATDRLATWTKATEGLFECCESVLAGGPKGRVSFGWKSLTRMFRAEVAAFEHDHQGKGGLCSERAWEALVRSGANLILAEDSDEFQEAVKHDWSEWIEGKKPMPEEPDDETGDDYEEDE